MVKNTNTVLDYNFKGRNLFTIPGVDRETESFFKS